MNLVIFLTLCLFTYQQAHGGEEREEGHSTVSLTGCRGTEASVITAVNASTDFNSTIIVVNCLAYSDNVTISSGSISFQHIDGSSGRYVIECINGLLLLRQSLHNISQTRYHCYQCKDDSNPCVVGTECANGCQLCYNSNQSQCILCEHARYNSICIDDCPIGRSPNPENGNECECPENYIGTNCTECGLRNCPSTYLLDEENCACQTCPSEYHQQLVDPRSQVPDSVIGSPGSEDEHHERKRGTGEQEHEATELTTCVANCTDGWEPDHNNICYACGITYCLHCNEDTRSCEECRNGTLLNVTISEILHHTGSEPIHTCHGFYSTIRELAHELDEEEEHERQILAQEQLELKIILPIACVITIVIFVSLAVFAHFRYPHVGHAKRHRDPKKKQSEEDIEKRFRPKSIVAYR